jgi:hypothetical protein
VDALRVALRELGSRSDDDTIIGKLTLELSQIKVSYQQFVRKFETSRASLRQSNLTVRCVVVLLCCCVVVLLCCCVVVLLCCLPYL